MTFNIIKVLMYLYNGTKNYYSVTKFSGTAQEQYDTLTWSSEEDPPVEKPTLAYLESKFADFRKSELCSEISNLFNEKLSNALVPYDSAYFKTDKDSQIFLCAAICNGDVTRDFYDSDGNVHSFTKTQAIELSGIVANCTKAYEAARKSLVDAVNAAQDPDTIDIESGWPTNPYSV
jgi:hypothetical protein